jgi:hypothetical protein
MVAKTSDPSVDFVLTQIENMVAAEGGSLQLVASDESFLKVHYTPGVNEACPECVPTLEHVRLFLGASLKVHAPYITSVEVV